MRANAGAAGFARSCEADGIDGHCVAVGRIAPAPQLCTGAMAEKLASQRTEGIAVGQNDEGEAYSYNVVREMWILPSNVLFVSLAGRRIKRRSNRPIQ